MAAIAGGLGIGAGVGISSVALAPFNAANTFMGSAFFGYGMILGERYMYQADWPKIQARLEHGEKIENIIQEYTGVFTAVVMKEAKIIFDTVTQEFIQIMKEAAGITEPGGFTVTREKPTTPQPSPQPFIDTGETTKIRQKLSKFSDLHIETQKLMLFYIKETWTISIRMKPHVGRAGRAVRDSLYRGWITNIGKKWALTYSRNTYGSPVPSQQLPGAEIEIINYLKNNLN